MLGVMGVSLLIGISCRVWDPAAVKFDFWASEMLLGVPRVAGGRSAAMSRPSRAVFVPFPHGESGVPDLSNKSTLRPLRENGGNGENGLHTDAFYDKVFHFMCKRCDR